MKMRLPQSLCTLGILAVVLAMTLSVALPALGQDTPRVYTATAIASQGLAGASGRMNIRIVSFTTDDEKKQLAAAFQKNPEAGMTLLRSMSKGYVNIEGQTGRKILAAFSRELPTGEEIVVICEHLASKLETWNDVKAEDHPLAVLHLRFAVKEGTYTGEVFPAVKLAVTPDGFVDAKTDSSNKVTMINIARK